MKFLFHFFHSLSLYLFHFKPHQTRLNFFFSSRFFEMKCSEILFFLHKSSSTQCTRNIFVFNSRLLCTIEKKQKLNKKKVLKNSPVNRNTAMNFRILKFMMLQINFWLWEGNVYVCWVFFISSLIRPFRLYLVLIKLKKSKLTRSQ